MKRLLVLGGIAMAVALGACGNDEREPAALVPDRAPFFAELTLDPEGDQEEAIDALAGRLPGSGGAGDRLASAVDAAFRQAGRRLSFERDVEPWLGDSAAVFSTVPRRGGPSQGAVLLATEDGDAALRAADRAAGRRGREASYAGVDYRHYRGQAVAGVHHGYLVVGGEAAFRATVDATRDGGRPLSGDGDYRGAARRASGQRLATVYVDGTGLVDSVEALGVAALTPFGQLIQSPYLATVSADADGLTLDTGLPAAIPFFLGRGTDLLGQLPGDSWLALGQPDLRQTLEGYIGLFSSFAGGREQLERSLRRRTGLDLERDVLGWMGDLGVFVRGESERGIGGAAVLETRDPRASLRALRALARELRRRGNVRIGRLTAPVGGRGYTAVDPGEDRPVHVFQRGNRVVVAAGAAAARQAVQPRTELAASADFADAVDELGDGFAASSYLSIPAVLRLAESEGAGRETTFRRAKPYLEALGILVSGTSERGGRLRSRARLGVR